MSLSRCFVYTIDSEGFIVDRFECDREVAMSEYWNRRCPKGKYLIANESDKIKNQWKKKPLKEFKQISPHSENL